MPNAPADTTRILRWTAYTAIGLASLASVSGHLMSVVAETGESPMLSANDRSRWCTVRALVEFQTYEIDQVIAQRHPQTRRAFWSTIDHVEHRGRDGRQHLYSSKPPWFPTLIAGPYWCLHKLGGLSMATKPFYCIRLLLVLVNLVPLAGYLTLMAYLIDGWGRTDGGRILAMTVTAWGTFVTTFSVTLNNHVPAAITAAIALYALLKILAARDETPSSRSSGAGKVWFVLAGLGAALTAANELPALALLVSIYGLLARADFRKTMLWTTPPILVVAVLFFGTNWAAHQSWRPPYAHRGDGPTLLSLELKESERQALEAGELPRALRQQITSHVEPLGEAVDVLPRRSPAKADPRAPRHRWEIRDPQSGLRLAANLHDQQLQIRAWDHWYEYDDSYWMGERQGVDRGEPSRAVYAFHVLVGHHGLFSLTPAWLLAVLGAFQWLRGPAASGRWIAGVIVLLTLVCLAFYLNRPLIDRNYGGVSCTLRWMIWFSPLWIFLLLPAADRFQNSRWLRGLSWLLVAVSIFSAAYPAANPWTPPWLYQYWDYLGWLGS